LQSKKYRVRVAHGVCSDVVLTVSTQFVRGFTVSVRTVPSRVSIRTLCSWSLFGRCPHGFLFARCAHGLYSHVVLNSEYNERSNSEHSERSTSELQNERSNSEHSERSTSELPNERSRVSCKRTTRKICKNLSVKANFFLIEFMHKLGVAHTFLTCSSIDTCYPQSSECSFLITSSFFFFWKRQRLLIVACV